MSEDTPSYTPPNMTATEIQMRQILAPLHRQVTSLESAVVNMKSPTPTTPVAPDKAAIYTALAAAQVEIQNATTNVENNFTNKKYADLASVLDAVRAPLAKNGIALFQITEDQSSSVLGIRTILAHESGQTIQDLITMSPPKLDPQGVGSCRTYMRRYAILAMTGIAGAEDNDAEGTKADPEEVERISKTQVDELLVLADNLFKKSADAVVERMLSKVFDLTALKDIPATLFDQAKTLLENQANREKKEAKPAAKDKADK